MSLSFFCFSNYDTPDLQAIADGSRFYHRNINAELFNKQEKINGKDYNIPWRRFHFKLLINHGLARIPDHLPSEIPYVLRFHRAPSNYALMQTSKKILATNISTNAQERLDYSYNEPVIPLIDPVLSTYYGFSSELETKMSTGPYDRRITYLDCQARREVLDTGLQNYQIALHNGKFPKHLMIVLSTLERLGGSENLSLTKFTQSGLEHVDLLLDQESVLGFPLNGVDKNAVGHYQQYLKATNRFCNPWAG